MANGNPYLKDNRVYCPVIFLRGYAMRRGDIEEAVEDPFSGYAKGSTKYRQNPGSKEVGQRYFESPVIRLATDHGYRDVYDDGAEPETTEQLLRALGLDVLARRSDFDGSIDIDDLTEAQRDALVRSMWVCRYYEQASEPFGDSERQRIPELAGILSDTIEKVRGLYTRLAPELGGNNFRVLLVAHSMGGLIVRCYLQNVGPAQKEANDIPNVPVDKVFTYGTPHNGIEIKLLGNFINFGIFDINNFYRPRIAKYLRLPGHDSVNTLGGAFEPRRFFCLVGTNHKDYDLTRAAVDPRSDGLVLIKNATVQGSPRAHVPRAHSGPYGLVNSEDGYQNLQRFFFGDTRVNGKFKPTRLPLPDEVKDAIASGKRVLGNIYFDATVTVRGSFGWYLTQRLHRDASAVWRSLNQLYTSQGNLREIRPVYLFSTFMDRRKIVRGRHLSFQLQLSVSSDGFEIDRRFWLDRQFGLYRFLDLTLDLTYYIDSGNLRVSGVGQRNIIPRDGGYDVEIKSGDVEGVLRLDVRDWS